MHHRASSRAAVLLFSTVLASQPMLAQAQGSATGTATTPPATGSMTSPATPAPLLSPPAQTGQAAAPTRPIAQGPAAQGSTAQGSAARPAAAANPVAASPAAKAAGVPEAQTPRGQRVVNQAEQRIDQLHKQLRITAAEQAQWDQFAAVMRDNAQHMDQVFADRGNPTNGTALDDMRAYQAITQAHADDVNKLAPAFEALYSAMSPDQKKTADNVFHSYARQQAAHPPRG